MHRIFIPLIALALAACDTPKPSKPAPPAAPTPAPTPPAPSAEPTDVPLTRHPAPARLVALGDLHGDLDATRAALRLAGATDAKDAWIGGELVVVQTGDQLDRGDDELAILDLLERLSKEAKAAGGALIALNGNHEVMNIQGDMRYVTPGSLSDFEKIPGLDLEDPFLERYPPPLRPRVAAFRPGAPLARRLSTQPLIAVVGQTAFAHGGVHIEHVEYGLEKINAAMHQYALGTLTELPPILSGPNSPHWSRRFSDEAVESDCAALKAMLDTIPAKRLIVGHTVQKDGVTSACEGMVWRVDVGMAAHYGGSPSVLEIKGDTVRIVR